MNRRKLLKSGAATAAACLIAPTLLKAKPGLSPEDERMASRFEWIYGPVWSEATRTPIFHFEEGAPKKVTYDLPRRRMIYGQLREKKSGLIFCWAKSQIEPFDDSPMERLLVIPRAPDASADWKFDGEHGYPERAIKDFETWFREGVLRNGEKESRLSPC